MSRKKDILTNLREYSSDQIVEAINDGVVTLYELSKSGNLTPLMRRRIEEKLATGTPDMTTKEFSKQESMLSDNAKASVDNVEVTSNQEKKETEDKMEVATVPEVVIPEAVIEPVEQASDYSANAEEQEQPVYDEGPSNRGMFKRPFSFHGRIRRLEYGLSILLVYFYAFMVGAILGVVTNGNSSDGANYVFLIPGYWFIWAQGAKRCHDRNNSGWYQIIPFYGFWMLFADGDEGENDYGDNPKGK